MGVLYRALDTHLDRIVAIKLLRPEAVGDPERKRRFILEAKAASALNHPNIITIHDIDQVDGVDFIAMEYVEGQPMGRLIEGRGLPVEEALGYAVQIADALAAAHAAGIVHRDIKPANVMVSRTGLAKVLDFGLAKLSERVIVDEAAPTLTGGGSAGTVTGDGVIMGTVAYMAPEQAEGKPVDARSDVFSFGALLYEMLTGRRAFTGDSQLSILSAILREPPAPVRKIRPDVPPALERVVLRCLEKERESRYTSAAQLRDELRACQAPVGIRKLLRQPRYAVALILALLAVPATATWWWVSSSRIRWARNVALPEISRLANKGSLYAAFQLARHAKRYLPDDSQLEAAWRSLAMPASIRTTPPGANVYVRDYLAAEDPAAWELLGQSPLEQFLVPLAHLRWKLTKEGFEDLEGATAFFPSEAFRLHPRGSTPPGMVLVPSGSHQLGGTPPVQLADYWLDKYEVTNRQFQEFVNAGGYVKRQFWKQPFVKDGQVLSWEQAMAEFRDTTGRPGPSTWEMGTYPEGQADLPVSGVSWYEAAAYADFAGKSLPTIYHWDRAAGSRLLFEVMVRLSNFGGKGPVRVGSHQGISPFGAYDMAGNVREWCWNQTGAYRYILGWAYGDPEYMLVSINRMPPFDRSRTHGFRCVMYTAPLPEALAAPVETPLPDYSQEKPASDEVFRAYKSIYAYDRADLQAAVEAVDDSSEYWRKEKVSFNAAYGGQRVIAYLFLPRNAAPPYQVVLYFPHSRALSLRTFSGMDMPFLDFIIRSGRAVIYPIYQDTYERRVQAAQRGPNFVRDRGIQWFKDLARSIDYLETRSNIDHRKLAYYAVSLGAGWGPVFTALEERIKVSVLVAGGLNTIRRPPESEPLHFAPRARQPVLMMNGRHDYAFPLETTQRPLFRLLGAPEKDKRHVVVDDAGHGPPRQFLIKEVLDWLDRYLGPVTIK